MKTSIATVSISGSLEGKLRAVAEAGFDAVEIFENDLLGFPGTPREVGRIVRDLGMQCALFQPFRDLEGMPPEQLSRAYERIERNYALLQDAVGCGAVERCRLHQVHGDAVHAVRSGQAFESGMKADAGR